jgi:hypothetical protein
VDVEENFVIGNLERNLSSIVDFDILFKKLFVLDEASPACWAIVGEKVPSVG